MIEISHKTTELIGRATPARIPKKGIETNDPEHRRLAQLRIAFWIIAGITGFVQIWLRDYIVVSDSLSYLDSGDMLWRGDFANAITNHWSPGLPFLLGLALKILHPAGLWEVAVVKLVDMIIFVFTIACFSYFVDQFCRYHESSAASEHLGTKLVVPKLALAAVAYLLFLWTITHLLFAYFTTPDMLVMGIVFVVFGLLLKIEMGARGFVSFTILGVVLGCGYLVKAPMFPLALMFLGIACFLVGDFKKAIPRVALAFGLFALIAAPLVWELSKQAGGPTFGKSGAWNYARTVNGIGFPYHWRGEPAGSGTPLHPTRIIFQNPTVYEFGSPVRGTFPPWRDPYYWFEGITPHFVAAGQLRVLRENLSIYKGQASELNRSFVYGFLILLCMSSDWRLIGRIVTRQWFLILPSFAILAMFSLVVVEGRYIAPYPIVIGLVLFSGVAITRSATSLKLVYRTVLLSTALFAVSSARPAKGELISFARSLHGNEIMGRGGPWHVSSAAVSGALNADGLKRGDKVAYIGASDDFYWARLAGVEVNAEIRQWDTTYFVYSLVPKSSLLGLEPSVDIYWASSPEVKEKIDRVLYAAGSRAIVTDAFPATGATGRWDHVPGTSFYIHPISGSAEGDGGRVAPLLPGGDNDRVATR